MAGLALETESLQLVTKLVTFIVFVAIYWLLAFPPPRTHRTDGAALPSRQEFLDNHIYTTTDLEGHDDFCPLCNLLPTAPTFIGPCFHILCTKCLKGFLEDCNKCNLCPQCNTTLYIQEHPRTVFVSKIFNTTWAVNTILGLLVALETSSNIEKAVYYPFFLLGCLLQLGHFIRIIEDGSDWWRGLVSEWNVKEMDDLWEKACVPGVVFALLLGTRWLLGCYWGPMSEAHSQIVVIL